MQFQYVAYTLNQGIVKGKVEARTEAEVRDNLVGQGYKPLSISPPSKLDFSKFLPSMEAKVKPGELMAFCRTASTMLASGANLLRVLEMLQAEGTGGAMRKVLARMTERISAGDSFTLALREYPKVFDDVFVSLVEVGEFTGRLGPALAQLADIMEQAHEAKQRAVKAMMMPIFLIGSSFLMLGFMVFVAFPPLLSTFESMDVDIPLPTKIMIAVVNGVVSGIIYIGAILGALIFLYKLLSRFPTSKSMLHYGKAKAPLLGGLIVASELGTFSRIMATLINAGVDVPSALRLAMTSSKNESIRQAWIAGNDSLIAGHRMAEALLKHPILPTMFVELTAIGEDTNSLGKTMGELADAYQKQFEEKIGAILAIAEPVSTFAVGGLVLFMALSVMKPILSASNEI